MLAGDAGPLSSPDALTGVAMSLSTLSDLPNAPPGKFGSSPGSGKQRELTLEGGTTNLQHAREATSRRRSRQQQLGPMHDYEKSRGLQEAKCSSQRAATRRLGEVYDGFFSKQREGRGGVDLQLQEHHQQVRGEAHARTGRRVKEMTDDQDNGPWYDGLMKEYDRIHRARALENRKDIVSMHMRGHGANDFPYDERYEPYIARLGLLPFLLQFKRPPSPVALTALVDRWRPETHSFHLPCGEMTMTLEDMAMISGLPINGRAVTDHVSSNNWRARVGVLIGVEPEKAEPNCFFTIRMRHLILTVGSMVMSFINLYPRYSNVSWRCVVRFSFFGGLHL